MQFYYTVLAFPTGASSRTPTHHAGTMRLSQNRDRTKVRQHWTHNNQKHTFGCLQHLVLQSEHTQPDPATGFIKINVIGEKFKYSEGNLLVGKYGTL
jgi:hypothetical protein